MTPYFTLGGITLYHGDCIDLQERWRGADVLITDPPYGIKYTGRGGKGRPIAGDHDTGVRDAALEIWGGAKPAAVFGSWKQPRPQHTKQRLIWDKTDGTGPGMGDLRLAFGSSEEEIYLLGFWPIRDRRHGNVLRTAVGMSTLVQRVGHPTPKPLELMRRLIHNAPDGAIADPFAGSGSTLMAAFLEGRAAVGVELDEQYCEIAANRLVALSMSYSVELP